VNASFGFILVELLRISRSSLFGAPTSFLFLPLLLCSGIMIAYYFNASFLIISYILLDSEEEEDCVCYYYYYIDLRSLFLFNSLYSSESEELG
jgi:hypothetical protein